MPTMPRSFSTRAQLNYKSHGFTAELFRKVDRDKKRDVMKLKSSNFQALYILQIEDNAFLTIKYDLQGPVCTTEHVSAEHSVFDGENADPLGILRSLQDLLSKTKTDEFRTVGEQSEIRGIPTQTWETCQYSERLKAALFVSISFAKESWISAHGRSSGMRDIVRVQVEVQGRPDEKDILLIADFYDFHSELYLDTDFQIPEYVHCPAYRMDKKQVPIIPSAFSYQCEIMRYPTTSSEAEISHLTVYYDYREAIIRVDYHGPTKKQGTTAIRSISRTFIFDFNSGVQYTFDPMHGTCSIDGLNNSLDVFDQKKSIQRILSPSEFFNFFTLKDNPLSYNGVYKSRGLSADVFSSSITDSTIPGITTTRQIFWYFVTDRMSILDTAGKNTLVKMVSIPEKNLNSVDDEIHIHFYNFKKEEPSPKEFDITACYNESLAKEFLITFPGDYNNALEENTYLLKQRLQSYIKEIAGVSLHRVYVQQIDFQSPYLLAQFKILDHPPVRGSRPVSPENDLNTAVKLLQKSVDTDTFSVEIVTANKLVVILKPEPDGFKPFKPDRPTEDGIEFNESSFVGMAIGMSVLGFLLGGVVINLVFTRKYGVSLLQASGAPTQEMSFGNPLTESTL